MKDLNDPFVGWDIMVRRRHDGYGHHVSFSCGQQLQDRVLGVTQPCSPMPSIDVFTEGEGLRLVWHPIDDRLLRGIPRDVYGQRAIDAVRSRAVSGAG